MSQLCNANKDTFWPRLKWPDVASMPRKEKVVIILPIVGFSDWGERLPLDAEEQLAMRILKEASIRLHPSTPHWVLPPQRFVTGSAQTSAFTLGPDEVFENLSEIAAGVKASGFHKLVFFNSSPWNEDLLDATARDLRIEQGLQLFCINLSALGVDLSKEQRSEDLRNQADNLVSLIQEVADKANLPNEGMIPVQKGEGK